MAKAICLTCGKKEPSKHTLPEDRELEACSTCVQAMVGHIEEKGENEVKNEMPIL